MSTQSRWLPGTLAEDIREEFEALQAENERLTDLHRKAVAEAAILMEEKADRDEENERLREALRTNVGEAYNLITQGESPTQRRQPSAQRIYDRARQALAENKEKT